MGPGEAYSILSAVAWAFGVICMRKTSQQLDPLSFNIFKIALAIILVFVTFLFSQETVPFASISIRDLVVLVVSGIIGIGIADTLWLAALRSTDATTMAIVDCAYSPSVVFMSFLFLAERLTVLQFIGGICILMSVFTVIPSKQDKLKPGFIAGGKLQGVLLGALAVVLMAIGVVLMKPILRNLPVLFTTEVRLISGFSVLLLLSVFSKKKTKLKESFLTAENKKIIFLGAFLGAYLAMIFWIAGFKYTTASIAAILNQTSTIFIIILAV
ncbi:MAG: DMT family transporter [Bdellovibrionota bacterium]